jgi:hypothetical protein
MSKWGRNLRRKWENILLYGSRTFLKALNHYGLEIKRNLKQSEELSCAA